MAEDGYIKESYYVFEYPDWVNTIALTHDEQFVLVQQYRHGLGKTSFELCAGICDPDDLHPLTSAKRELKEETGFTGGEWSYWMSSCANPGTHTNMVHCYLAKGVVQTDAPELEPSEYLTVHVLDQTEVYDLLVNDKIVQSLHAAALWKYFALK